MVFQIKTLWNVPTANYYTAFIIYSNSFENGEIAVKVYSQQYWWFVFLGPLVWLQKRFRYMRIFRLQQKLKDPTQNFVKILPVDLLLVHEDTETCRNHRRIFFPILSWDRIIYVFFLRMISQSESSPGLQPTVYAHLFTYFNFIKYLLTFCPELRNESYLVPVLFLWQCE
jgi:hypothetical protein